MWFRFIITLVIVCSVTDFAFGFLAMKPSPITISITQLQAITKVRAREVLDSRGFPTVEATVITDRGVASAIAPSGASTGIHEAHELRDGDKARYNGKGCLKACANIQDKIASALVGMNAQDQEAIDAKMCKLDGTQNKHNLGANAILAVSLATAKVAALETGTPFYRYIGRLAGNSDFMLPVPSFNVINGGAHAGNALAFQEFMIMPTGASSFKEAMQIGSEVYQSLKNIIKSKYGQDAINVGDEGGFAPPITNNKEGVELLMQAIEKTHHKDKIDIAMDVASSEFYVNGKYDLGKKLKDQANKPHMLSSDELGEFYKELLAQFPIVSIEDPFDQDDWSAWSKLTKAIGTKTQIVGDDLTVTNPTRIHRAVAETACNCLLLKLNQIGTLSEAIQAVKMAKQAGWGVMTSHRSGETEDTTIAAVAVGLCTGQIKSGAPARSERVAKYNELLRIEEDLGNGAVYTGKAFRKPTWMASDAIKSYWK